MDLFNMSTTLVFNAVWIIEVINANSVLHQKSNVRPNKYKVNKNLLQNKQNNSDCEKGKEVINLNQTEQTFQEFTIISKRKPDLKLLKQTDSCPDNEP